VKEYRHLECGEIIREGDQVDACNNPMKDDADWVPTTCAGQRAPNPKYISHRQYRRPIDPMQEAMERGSAGAREEASQAILINEPRDSGG